MTNDLHSSVFLLLSSLALWTLRSAAVPPLTNQPNLTGSHGGGVVANLDARLGAHRRDLSSLCRRVTSGLWSHQRMQSGKPRPKRGASTATRPRLNMRLFKIHLSLKFRQRVNETGRIPHTGVKEAVSFSTTAPRSVVSYPLTSNFYLGHSGWLSHASPSSLISPRCHDNQHVGRSGWLRTQQGHVVIFCAGDGKGKFHTHTHPGSHHLWGLTIDIMPPPTAKARGGTLL